MTLAAGAPADAPVEGTAQLAAFLESGAKPRARWRIGTEHEKFGFDRATLRPLPYEGAAGIRTVLERLAARHGWRPVREDGRPIGLAAGRQAITLEPGGQVELSGAPLATLHETCAEANHHLEQLKDAAADLDIGFLGLGFHPRARVADMPRMPKARYRRMAAYMPTVGDGGLDMMFRTATVQVNLDFDSEADMVRKFRVALALQPVATALFANSPFAEGRPTGMRSTRARTWLRTDPARTGAPAFVFEDGMGFERYVDWALDVPLYFVARDGALRDARGGTFRDFLGGRLDALPGQRPTLADWELHLSTLFPDVRMKQFLEMRGADAGPWARICALPALWVGMLYDDAALDAAWDIVKRWSPQDRERMAAAVPERALDAPAPDGGPGPAVRDLAAAVVELAAAGLRRRGRRAADGDSEARYLEPLFAVLDAGRTPAEDLLALYRGRWAGSVDPAFAEFAY